MKILLTIFLTLLFQGLYATNYYVAATGNNSNSGLSGSPWQTLAKVNSVWVAGTFAPGDNIFFNRGDVFAGSLVVSEAGAAGNPITVGAYGTGADPIISGFANVTSWVNLGSNIWESTGAVSTLATLNMVVINGVNTAMGRTPNYPNYYLWQTHAGSGASSTLTSSSLNAAATNWTGAELAFFSTTYIVNRFFITAASGSQVTYNATTSVLFQTPSAYFVQNFIIQNDARTLDLQNEWYYTPSKKLRIYSTSQPTNVKVATLTNLVSWPSFKDYVTIRDLAFEGANGDAFVVDGVVGTDISACDLSYIGGNGIFGKSFGSAFLGNTIDSCTVNEVQNLGIDVSEGYSVTYNTVRKIGMHMGMQSPAGATTTLGQIATGIRVNDDNSVVAYNNVDSTGYIGIRWYGNGTIINNNFVNHACHMIGVKDGGGIYTWNGTPGTVFSGCQVKNNIVLNSGHGHSQGIYFDSKGNGTEVFGNTVAGAEWCLLLGDQTYNINVHHNTFYDPNSTNSSSGTACVQIDTRANNPSNNFILKHNKLIARTATQSTLWTLTKTSSAMPVPFTSDSNYFARPIDDNLTIRSYFTPDGNTFTNTYRNLPMWRTFSGKDLNSFKSPAAITNLSQLDFQYNATTSAVAKPIPPGTWIDVYGTTYSGTITLQPYTSAVLINTGTGNTLPVANAGANQVLTWTTNSATLSGSGTDADGTITGYAWSKVSGPAPYGLTGAGSATASVTGLTTGAYAFRLTVTDNSGGTASDDMQVTVNKGSATIGFSAPTLSQVYTGTALSPTVTTNPAGLSYSLTLGGVTGGKINVGTYPAIAGITDPNWNFTPASNTFTITKATAVINATGKTVNYDGNPQTITATTTPSVPGVTATYTGISGTVYPTSATPPSAIGTYRVDFILTNANYQATSINVTLSIVSNPEIIYISDTFKIHNGLAQGVKVTTVHPYSVTYNGSATVPTLSGSYQTIATITSGGTGADTATFVIAKRTGVLSWAPILAIPYGSQLTTTQLNASADIPGTWSYSLPPGTIPPIGLTGITATFTPTDPANFIGGTVNNTISVFGVNPFFDYFISGANGLFFIEQ